MKPPPPPPAPGDGLEGELTVTDYTTDSITVTWTKVESIEFTGFLLQAVPESGTSVNVNLGTDATQEYTFTGLQSGVRYTINNILQGTEPSVTRTAKQRTSE